jgi:hypothetical protein
MPAFDRNRDSPVFMHLGEEVLPKKAVPLSFFGIFPALSGMFSHFAKAGAGFFWLPKGQSGSLGAVSFRNVPPGGVGAERNMGR